MSGNRGLRHADDGTRVQKSTGVTQNHEVKNHGRPATGHTGIKAVLEGGGSGRRGLRQAIGSLCKVLCGLGLKVNAEMFRQAKHNGLKNTTIEFWKVLFSLLKQLHEGTTSVSTDGEIGSQIVFVKSVLWYYGYGSLEFYQLPGDGSEGSRELLLAFSWLLQRISLLEQILYLHKAQLKDTVLHCTCKMNDTKSWQISEHSEQHLEKQIPDIRCIQWLQGKLDFRFKVLHAMQQAKCGATYKIHHYTRGCHTGQNHLSIMEVNLIQDPSSLNKVLHTLESENARLDAYLEWKRLEPIYWHWMESVLDAKLKDNFECAARPLNTSTNDCTHCSDDCPLTEIGQLTALVETLQNELQENMSRLKTQWSARVKREEKKLLDEELFVEKLKKLQNEVELKFASAREKWRQTLKHGTYQLLLQEDPFQVKKGTSSISRNKELHGNVVKASEMVADLQKTESLLQNELTILQEECRNHLKQIAGSLQGIICIPPVKT